MNEWKQLKIKKKKTHNHKFISVFFVGRKPVMIVTQVCT